jgi:hypothetical protein
MFHKTLNDILVYLFVLKYALGLLRWHIQNTTLLYLLMRC